MVAGREVMVAGREVMVAGREVMFALQVSSKLAELLHWLLSCFSSTPSFWILSMVSAGNACKC